MDKACVEVRDLIALGGDASAHERIAIESHVSICSECARELAETRSLVGSLGLLREGEMPAGAAERIWRGVQSAVPGRRRRSLLHGSIRAAAVLVIGLSVGYTSTSIARVPASPGSTLAEETLDDAPSTYVSKEIHPAFGGRTPAPKAPGMAFVPVLPASTSHYLAPVEEVLEEDEVRF